MILALAAFFLPLILDSEKYRSKIVSQIPEMPRSQSQENDHAQDLMQSSEQQAMEAGEQNSNNSSTDEQSDRGTLVINLEDDNVSQQTLADNDSAANQIQEPSTSDRSNDKSSNEQVVEKQPEQLESSNQQSKQGSEQGSEQESEQESEQQTAANNDKITTQTQPVESQSPVSETQSKVADATVEDKAEQPEPVFQDQPWVIQIGSFSNKDNASALVENLRSQGYRAYQRVSEQFARVFVGPYPDKKSAESRQSELEKIVGAPVKLLEFEPKAH